MRKYQSHGSRLWVDVRYGRARLENATRIFASSFRWSIAGSRYSLGSNLNSSELPIPRNQGAVKHCSSHHSLDIDVTRSTYSLIERTVISECIWASRSLHRHAFPIESIDEAPSHCRINVALLSSVLPSDRIPISPAAPEGARTDRKS